MHTLQRKEWIFLGDPGRVSSKEVFYFPQEKMIDTYKKYLGRRHVMGAFQQEGPNLQILEIYYLHSGLTSRCIQANTCFSECASCSEFKQKVWGCNKTLLKYNEEPNTINRYLGVENIQVTC